MTANHKSYLLAAENESDFKDWLLKLSSVLQQNKLQEEKRAASLERGTFLSPALVQVYSADFQSGTLHRHLPKSNPMVLSKVLNRV